ncbi:hypothetical protein GCM10027268_04090 [Brachybacterium huguangmaarense]
MRREIRPWAAEGPSETEAAEAEGVAAAFVFTVTMVAEHRARCDARRADGTGFPPAREDRYACHGLVRAGPVAIDLSEHCGAVGQWRNW